MNNLSLTRRNFLQQSSVASGALLLEHTAFGGNPFCAVAPLMRKDIDMLTPPEITSLFGNPSTTQKLDRRTWNTIRASKPLLASCLVTARLAHHAPAK